MIITCWWSCKQQWVCHLDFVGADADKTAWIARKRKIVYRHLRPTIVENKGEEQSLVIKSFFLRRRFNILSYPNVKEMFYVNDAKWATCVVKHWDRSSFWSEHETVQSIGIEDSLYKMENLSCYLTRAFGTLAVTNLRSFWQATTEPKISSWRSSSVQGVYSISDKSLSNCS